MNNTSLRAFLIFSILSFAFIFYPGISEAAPPNMPSNPSPADGTPDSPLTVTFTWTGGDPDVGDTVVYDFYLDVTDPPGLLTSGLDAESFAATLTQPDTTYYWQVVAWDDSLNETTGPVWSLTTGPDADGDGVIDSMDVCPTVYDPLNDPDDDGLCGDEDNCAFTYNLAPQDDSNGDGIGDACTVTHCVSTSSELDAALLTAKSNGMHDIIQIQQGIYTKSSKFEYSTSNEYYGISIEGGYSDSCSARELNPENTVLATSSSSNILVVSSIPTVNVLGGEFRVEGLTLRRGNNQIGLVVRSDSLGSNIVVANNVIRDGSGDAGAVYLWDFEYAGNIVFVNNIVVNNLPSDSYWYSLRISAKNITVTNNTFANNNCYPLLYADDTLNFYNNILWNTGGSYDAKLLGNVASEAHNNVYDPSRVIHSQYPLNESNNILVDPLFMDPANGNYNLSLTSPAINAGNNSASGLPATDIEDHPRIRDGVVDIGAAEYNPVSASFTADPRSGEEPLTVQFYDASTSESGTINSWAWDMDSNGIIDSLLQHPSAFYAGEGLYSVTLKVTDTSGDYDTRIMRDYISVYINTAPVAVAGPDVTATVGEVITFDGSGSYDPDESMGGQIVSYAWDFGDTATGSGVSPTHSYGATGTYTVTLTVTDDNNATGQDTLTVTVHQAPVADAGPDVSATTDEVITFDGSGSTDPDVGGTIISYDWDFGDTASGSGVSPTHSYGAGGTYTVTLTVTDDLGATDQDTLTVTVNQAPVAVAGPDVIALPGEVITFDGSGSTDSDGTIVSYDWDFGDTATGSGVSPTHSYGAGGTYTVTLTVTDDNNATDQDTLTVTVHQAPVAVAGPDVLAVPDEVITFDGSGSTDPDGTIISYDWDFGDTATGSGVSPTHSYTTVGTYTVTLTVTDDLGATDQDTLTVTVNHAPVAVAGPDVSATTDEVITFDGSGSTDDGTIVSYDWDFGDTAIGNGVSPTHSYSSVGYYTVTLTVTDDMGWTGQDTLTVTVNNSGPTGITKRVSVDSNGNQGNNDSYETTMSADGRYAAFDSYASNLVPGDTNGALDIFVHDRLTGITNRVSVDSDGNQGNNDSIEPTISADGRYVAFFS
ncbi:MAG: PKD domain-containing protein, partial [Planctomycetota bacterium]